MVEVSFGIQMFLFYFDVLRLKNLRDFEGLAILPTSHLRSENRNLSVANGNGGGKAKRKRSAQVFCLRLLLLLEVLLSEAKLSNLDLLSLDVLTLDEGAGNAELVGDGVGEPLDDEAGSPALGVEDIHVGGEDVGADGEQVPGPHGGAADEEGAVVLRDLRAVNGAAKDVSGAVLGDLLGDKEGEVAGGDGRRGIVAEVLDVDVLGGAADNAEEVEVGGELLAGLEGVGVHNLANAVDGGVLEREDSLHEVVGSNAVLGEELEVTALRGIGVGVGTEGPLPVIEEAHARLEDLIGDLLGLRGVVDVNNALGRGAREGGLVVRDKLGKGAPHG